MARRSTRSAADVARSPAQRAGAPSWLLSRADGACLHVVVVPNAARSGVAGVHGDALRIRVAAVPVDGRANDALLDVLAQALGVPRRDLRLDTGHGSRRKRVVVALPAAVVQDRLQALLSAAGASAENGG